MISPEVRGLQAAFANLARKLLDVVDVEDLLETDETLACLLPVCGGTAARGGRIGRHAAVVGPSAVEGQRALVARFLECPLVDTRLS